MYIHVLYELIDGKCWEEVKRLKLPFVPSKDYNYTDGNKSYEVLIIEYHIVDKEFEVYIKEIPE